MDTFSNLFQQNFEIVKAVSPSLIDEAYKLRYQVYCEEKGYEDATRYPDGREIDEYDNRAVHSLVRHRHSGIYVGVVRLVLPQLSGVDCMLPTEEHCGLNLAESHPRLAKLSRYSVGEISRFSVSKVFRRRIAEEGLIWGVCQDGESYNSNFFPGYDRRHLPMITLGLISAVFSMAAEHGLEYCYAAMEPTLLRLLKRFGINFQALSMPVDYHGMRVPAVIQAKDIFKAMHEHPELRDIAAGYLSGDQDDYSQNQRVAV